MVGIGHNQHGYTPSMVDLLSPFSTTCATLVCYNILIYYIFLKRKYGEPTITIQWKQCLAYVDGWIPYDCNCNYVTMYLLRVGGIEND